MLEYDKLFEEEFFVIDSDNLDSVEDKFYGYTIINNELADKDSFIEGSELKGNGAYVHIKNEQNEITIQQDFNGSYGLYLYEEDGYFAISNSFLKLVEHLVSAQKCLSFNEKYSESFLFSDLCSYAYGDTLVNEISLLPRNKTVKINKSNNDISYETIDFQERSVKINSEDGLKILDSWYFRWIELIRHIKSKTNNLSVDLSGGFDSRVVAALWLTANIDLNKVRIKSHEDELYVHKEDYLIASQIADRFNFTLNNQSFSYVNEPFKEILTPINISFYTKLGFHKQMYFKLSRASEPVYTITGEGGESIRGYSDKTPEDYLKHIKDISDKYDKALSDTSKLVVEQSWDKLIKDFDLDDYSNLLTEIQYNEVRSRHHFGKAAVESMFSNWYTLTPLIDLDLRKLDLDIEDCEDKKLLIALIYSRYCPELLDFGFEGGREISNDTIDYAKRINEKYPFKPRNYEFISGPEITPAQTEVPQQGIALESVEDYLKGIFYSNSFEKEYKKYFSEISYNSIVETVETRSYHPLTHVYSALAIILVRNLISSQDNCDLLMDSFLKNNARTDLISNEVKLDLLKYVTARIDIKCYGNDSDVEIIENSDIYSKNSTPDWFKLKEGKGCIIESFKGTLKLKIKCLNSGNLKLWFRARNITDDRRNALPVYVDYSTIKINDENIINESKLVWHDTPFIYEKAVQKSEIVEVYVEWNPVNVASNFEGSIKNRYDNLLSKYNALRAENKDIKIENKNLKIKNENLEKQLNDLFNSRSWRYTSILRRK